MKFLKYISIFAFAVLFMGCEDYFGENANVDPDSPTTATVNVLLPQVQARLTYTYGGDFTRYLGINTQHVDGLERQFAVIGNYGIVPSDVDAAWNNIYTGTLNTNRVMTNIAIENGANHYQAVGLILESHAIMMATDAWGDIPYSDAIGFGANGGVYAPTLDSQEDIYNAIFANLATAKTLLAGPDGGNPVGSDDLFYGGDASAWSKYASVLMARGKLHLSKVNSGAYGEVLAALADGFSSSADDGGFSFGAAATENAPWFQYIDQRDDCEVGASYVALLGSLNDPRMASYGATHDLPHPVFTPDQKVNLLTYTEQEFMKAEAMMGTGDSDGALTAFTNGVTASFAEAGVTDSADDYISANYSGGINMNDIMTQKYIALYTSPEVFNDWRRSGIPDLTPNSGSNIPRRLPYSEAEQFANPDNIPSPAQVTIFDRVWWDQ